MAFTEENQIKNSGRIFSINYSKERRTTKKAIEKTSLIENFGLKDDAHGGSGLRQVSLLAVESIRRQIECPKVKEKNISLAPGDFAENITTQGLDLAQLNIGDRLNIGTKIILEISKIGKECHKHCAVYQKIGDCIMPREGIFAKVLKGGEIVIGDNIEVVKNV